MKDSKTIIGVVLLIAILIVAVGYAAIQNVALEISGSAAASASDNNFTVAFTDNISTDNSKVEGAVVLAKKVDATHASINVTGLTQNQDVVTATYEIANTSEDLSALLTVGDPTYSNHDFFEVTAEVVEPTLTLAAGGTAHVKVTVKLIQTPIDADVETDVTVLIDAAPVQPEPAA